jgi:hypothetical protein
MRRGGKRVKSGYGAEVSCPEGASRCAPGTAAMLVVHQVLRVAEAAAALRFVAECFVRFLRCARAGAGEVADLALADGIADADDHDDRFIR